MFFLMIRRPPRSTQSRSSAASDVYKRQVLLVTEPTPFGLHDLSLAVDMVRELNLPFGVLVNRMGSGDNRVHEFCRKENVPILMEIPDDRQIAENYSRGILMVDALPQYRERFENLLEKIANSKKKG